MILRKGTFAEFAQRVRDSGKNIILYGAGVIGETAAPYWLHEHRLDDAVLCYVDADAHKRGERIRFGSRAVAVEGFAALEANRGSYILLVTVSAFEPHSREPSSILNPLIVNPFPRVPWGA